MNGDERKRIDILLCDWSARHRLSEGGEDDLQARIRAASWANEFEVLAGEHRAGTGQRAAVWTALTVVFVCAGVLGLAVWMPLDRPDPDPPVDVTLPCILHSSKELAVQRQLLVETERLFDCRLAWFAEEGRRVDLGLASEAQPGHAGGAPVAIRLLLVRRSPRRTAWSPVRLVDVVARSETMVQWQTEKGALFLWAYVLPDGMIAVDTGLAAWEPGGWEPSASGLFVPGVPVRIAAHHTETAEYQLWQVASLLQG